MVLGMSSFLKLGSLLWVTATSTRLSHNLFSLPGSCTSFARKMAYTIREVNSENTEGYRVYFQGNNGLISPWHDIPLFADKEKEIFNMVVEIPRWTNAKMEIATKERLNPIKQDIKKGKVRFVNNVFPYKGYIWNYGAFPQTWEDPEYIDKFTQFGGDNDPIDVCEIGEKVGYRGEVKQVKILGVMALIDEGETDWKVLAIDINDPLADKMNDVEDIRKYMPGLLEATHEWFKVYKMPTGKPENKFAFEGKTKDRMFATNTVMHTHTSWQQLINKKIENKHQLTCENAAVPESKDHISDEELNRIAVGLGKRSEPSAISSSVDKVYFIKDGKVVEG